MKVQDDSVPRETEFQPRVEFEKRLGEAKQLVESLKKELARLNERDYLIKKNADILRLDGRDPIRESNETQIAIRKAESLLVGAKIQVSQILAAERKELDKLKAQAWERLRHEVGGPYEDTVSGARAALEELRETLALLSSLNRELPAEFAAMTDRFDELAQRFDVIAKQAGAGHNLLFGDGASLKTTLTNALADNFRKAQFPKLIAELATAVNAPDKFRGMLMDRFREIAREYGIVEKVPTPRES